MRETILLIDKPTGITSFDVIRELRKRLGIKKMGHAGTLDPLATGLMVVGVEKGTKELKNYVGFDKTYVADVLLGMKTTTGDSDGEVVAEKEVIDVEEQEVQRVLESLVGKHILEVPVYSAMKMGGERMYEKARKGTVTVIPKREMEIKHIHLLDMYKGDVYARDTIQDSRGKKTILKVEMRVSSGTYVRSIAEEIGRRLGVPATISALRRTQVGDVHVDDAQQLEDV